MAKAKENFLQDDDTDITPAVLMRRVTGQEPQKSDVEPDENITSVQESVQVHKSTNNEGSSLINVATKKKTDNGKTGLTANERQRRIDRAETMLAEAEENGEAPTLVTLRVPAKLHDYLERYVRRINDNNPNKRRKYLKQDAIAAAFVAFYADHPMPPKLNENEEDL